MDELITEVPPESKAEDLAQEFIPIPMESGPVAEGNPAYEDDEPEAAQQEEPDFSWDENQLENNTESRAQEFIPTPINEMPVVGKEEPVAEIKAEGEAQREEPDTGSVEKPRENDTKNSVPENTSPTTDAAPAAVEERPATERKVQEAAQQGEPDTGSAENLLESNVKNGVPENTPPTTEAAPADVEERPAAEESKAQEGTQHKEEPDNGLVEKPRENVAKNSVPESTPTPGDAAPAIGEQQPAAAFGLPEETPNGESAGTQQGSDDKPAQNDGKASLIDSFLDLLRGDFGWDQELQSAEALDAMIKNGDILDKYGDKLVGDTPDERKRALEKRLKDGEILYVYQKGEKFPRQVTYDEKSKEFGVSESVDKIELEKIPKPHWFVRFYLNLFSLMYRGRSLDAVRDWEHYEHQKEAIAKAKSKSRIERRKRRDPSLNEKDKEKDQEKTEEKDKEEAKEEVKEEVKEEPKEVKEEPKEVKEEPKEVKEKPENEFSLFRDEPEEKVEEEPENEFSLFQNESEEKEQEKNEELEQPVADGIDAVANTKDNLKDLTHVDEPVKPYEPKGMNVVQEPAQREREEQQKEKQSEPIEENKVLKETEKEKREAERKPMRDLGGKEGAKEGADKKSPDGSITEADNFIRESNQRLLDGKLSAAMEKNIRTLYENAESAKKQLSIACAKGEKFAGGDSIAHLVAFNNVKNQIESGRLSYTTRQLLSSENGSKMMYDGVMCAGEVKYAAKAKHVPEFFKDYFLEQEHLDAITEKADDKMEKFLGEQCGDNLHSALANLDRQQRNRQSIREQQRDRQLTSNQSMGLGGP